MKKEIKSGLLKYVFLLCALCAYQFANAQTEWKSKGPLYRDKDITIEIEYAMGTDPCNANATPSQFRYKVTQLKKSKRDFYINWRFDYFNCEHQLKTRVNSLKITQATVIGYIMPPSNQFTALRLANNFNDVHKSFSLPEVSEYKPRSSISLEPKAILGKLAISRGESSTLKLLGGNLGLNMAWKWYENDCNGTAIGSGDSLAVQPIRTKTYAVRGEGASSTTCVFVTVTVSDVSLAATAVDGPPKICAGDKDVRLSVVGGRLADGAKWVWYAGDCGGTPIGSGPEIFVTPTVNTSYFVRAEGSSGNTLCATHQLIVNEKSLKADHVEGPGRIDYGGSFTLSVRGGTLAPDANWVWYAGSPGDGLPVGTGNTYTLSTFYSSQIYFVRAEGSCYKSEFVSQKVTVSERKIVAVKSSPPRFFINGGIVANDPNQLSNLKNYVATIGGGKNIGWFIRAKISSEQTKAAFESTGIQITDYNLPGYYQYTNATINKRAAYTGGVYLGGKNLAIYVGAGYGTRELLYSIDQYSYGSSLPSGTDWVKNTANSYTGAEIEGGLILKVSFFNIMGGASTIQGKYTDYNLGIGFNF